MDTYTANTFSKEVRDAIDRALSNDVDPETVAEVMEYHADGVEYYSYDAIRYNAPFLDEGATGDEPPADTVSSE
jgi:hypothetical protein